MKSPETKSFGALIGRELAELNSTHVTIMQAIISATPGFNHKQFNEEIKAEIRNPRASEISKLTLKLFID